MLTLASDMDRRPAFQAKWFQHKGSMLSLEKVLLKIILNSWLDCPGGVGSREFTPSCPAGYLIAGDVFQINSFFAEE